MDGMQHFGARSSKRGALRSIRATEKGLSRASSCFQMLMTGRHATEG
jgi:hypothetical protein